MEYQAKVSFDYPKKYFMKDDHKGDLAHFEKGDTLPDDLGERLSKYNPEMVVLVTAKEILNQTFIKPAKRNKR